MNILSRHEYFENGNPIAVLPRAPQPHFPEHTHDFHELVMVRSGCGVHYIDGQPYPVGKGSVFYLAAGHAHCFEQMDALCLTNVLFAPESLQNAMFSRFLPDSPEAGGRPLNLSSCALEECERLFAALRTEGMRDDPASRQMGEALFTQLVILLWREGRRLLDLCDGDSRLAALIRHIHEHMAESMDAAELADTYGIPERTLARRIVEVTGLSLNNYLCRVRLCHAMRMLSQGESSVTDIAFACGFNDSNYFSSRFRQEIGVTPMQYRKHPGVASAQTA
jgi:AraC family transcriptional regulator, L-rhamnose operon regulatory protein RhaS